MKLNFKNLFKFIPLIGIILLFYIINNIGFEKILNSFTLISPLYFIIAALVFIPRLFFSTYKWKYLLNKQKVDISFKNVAKAYLIGLFYGSITPGALGFHIRIYYIKILANISFEKCISSSFIDGTMLMISGLFISIFGSLLVISIYPSIFLLVLAFFILYVIIFVFFMEKKRGKKILSYFIKPFIPKKYKLNLNDSIDLLYEDLPKLRDTIIPFFLDFIAYSILGFQAYIIALGLNVNIPIFEFLLISISSVILASIIPITIGGLGVREGFFVIMIAGYGVAEDIALVLSIAGFLVKILIPGIVGLILTTSSSFKYFKDGKE